jgi:gas vesicle protein
MRVGDEVEALSYKTDVGARLEDYVDEKKQSVTSAVAGAKDAVTGAVDKVVPGSGPPRRRLRAVSHAAQRNPLGLAVGGAAVGFVAGMLLPSTRVEDEHLGEAAQKVRETASEAGHEALERGKDVAQSAMETVREEGADQGRELASDLKGRVQETPAPEQGTYRAPTG